MPVFEIRALPQKSGFDPVPVMKRLCSRVAQVISESLEMDPGNVFITYQVARAGEVFVGGGVRFK